MFYQTNKHCFSSEYCKALIEKAEAIGFETSKVNNGGVFEENLFVRNNNSVQFLNNDLTLDFEPFVPKLYKARKLSRVGDFFRIYKYEAGQFFKPHKDGHVELPDEESMLTLLVYLNTCPNAGTVLMKYGVQQKWAHTEIDCEEGTMLVFDHDIWHAGKTVEDGVKYVLRTDVFYKE